MEADTLCIHFMHVRDKTWTRTPFGKRNSWKVMKKCILSLNLLRNAYPNSDVDCTAKLFQSTIVRTVPEIIYSFKPFQGERRSVLGLSVRGWNMSGSIPILLKGKKPIFSCQRETQKTDPSAIALSPVGSVLNANSYHIVASGTK